VIAGESCRLIQLIPAAFVVRMVRAMDALTGEATDAGAVAGSPAAAAAAASGVDASPHSAALEEVLGGIHLRVWAELGRARMPLGGALGLPVGAVLDLDRSADAPVDLYVNGMRFASAQLIVTEEGEWAVSLQSLESEGMRLLERARAARPEGREDVETESQPLDYPSDLPIDNEVSSTNPETPDLKQPEVEGAVT
jgi:flagellar motor switch protein FliN/FliY